MDETTVKLRLIRKRLMILMDAIDTLRLSTQSKPVWDKCNECLEHVEKIDRKVLFDLPMLVQQ